MHANHNGGSTTTRLFVQNAQLHENVVERDRRIENLGQHHSARGASHPISEKVIVSPAGKRYNVYNTIMQDNDSDCLEDGEWVQFVWPDSQRVMSLKCAASGDDMDYFVPRRIAERYINDSTLYSEDDPEMPGIWTDDEAPFMNVSRWSFEMSTPVPRHP